MSAMIDYAERGLIPDPFIRFGIRKLLKDRIKEVPELTDQDYQHWTNLFIKDLEASPIATDTDAANDQHYEVPAEFFQHCLGKNLKYSSGYWENGARNLDEAEDHMLDLTIERAGIKDGMKVLDMGCGWGSVSLRIAAKFPRCQVTGVSNSSSQKTFIEEQARQRQLTNLTIVTQDMNVFQAEATFDRIVSVEMFEHMRNYEQLLQKVSTWLKDDGKLFIHIFCHKNSPYFFETEGDDNWMGRYFFTGGIMPSHQLLLYFQKHLSIENQWIVNGTNYEKTSRAWLDNTDQKRHAILPVLEKTYGPEEAKLWLGRWRIFFLACEELFGYRDGKEWWVSHYLFSKNKGST